MYIYFVRHGETEYNRKHIHQTFEVPLAESGRIQIAQAAEKLKEFPITKLITSDLVRTKQSAEIIGDALSLEPEENTLFREVRRPSELLHKHFFSWASIKTGMPMMWHLHDADWHYSDEENLYDLKKRVAEAVAYLQKLGEEHEHIAVVSHAFILQIFIKYMCAYKDVRVRDYMDTLLKAKKLGNASISTIAFNDDRNPRTCDWLALDLNNEQHLRT